MVVDDEVDLREILRDEFVFEGAEVQEATNGKEAFDLVQKNKFDLVLSDLRMPGGDGATLAREIRGLNHVHPVIVLITGFADLRSDEAYALGADGYVTKPFHLDELKQISHRLLTEAPQRWRERLPAENSKGLRLEASLEESIQSGQVTFGRSGLVIFGDFSGVRVGDLLKVQFREIDFLAWVRWVRSEGQMTDRKKTGIGLEIAFADDIVLPQLLKHLKPGATSIPN